PPGQRASMAKNPPHILITTPESLYILLTSQSGRRALKGVRTLILDELHAVVGNKRGSHLSLSAERLCALADGPVTRIGLSATQRPIEQVARYLVGTANIAPDGTPACVIVDSGHRRKMDLALELPPAELGPIASHELWDGTLDRVAALVGEHHTTIVFVNTRRLVERVSHQMALRLGEEAVVAHHGSLSQKTRHDAEQRLKTGTVRLCVATSSLELGIDVGAVDLVCQIGSPRSIGLLLQRVGRSGHSLGGLPKGRLFPLTRDELIECMALMRGIQRGNLDRLIMPSWPLDVLAQQVVAECGSRDWDEDELFELARQAYPYRELPREKYDAVIEALSYGVAAREGRRSAYLHRDAVNRKLKGRRGARLAALTSGGAIPDNSDYDVIVEPENTFVGKVNEDFAVESMKGDVFLLGNTPWRIRRIQSGVVRVEDAQGSAPSVPFWLGEAPGRTNELSDEVSDLREEMYQRIESGKAVAWLLKEGFARDAAEQAVAYLVEGMRVIGTVPTKKRIVAERFFDESGGMQLIVHSPYGSRINRAWGMALRKEICRTFDFELQAAATEDGLNFSLGPTLSFSLEDVFKYVPAHKSEKVLTQAILQVPIFGIRWRWAASRALALLRFSGGRKVPPPIQRMRSDDLLAAVFPAQVACQDNAPPGDIEVPDNPLVFETMRDCLTEAMDLQGFKQVLEGIARGEIEVFARDTTQPSVFSHQILNAMPYAFLDDAPLEERRSRAVALRRALPDNARDLGILDSSAIEDAARDAWPLVRDADELHDALLTLGMLPEQDIGKHAGPSGADGWKAWLAKLAKEGRAAQVHYGEGRLAWTAAERVAVVVSAFPDAKFSPALPVPAVGATRPTQDDAFLTLVRGHVECIGPFTIAGLAGALGLRPGDVDIALARMEGEGTVLRGRFTPGQDEEEFCDRRILARIHRATISRLRKEVEPVSPAAFMRFLFRWQHTAPAWQLQGEDGLAEVIEQLQGFEAAAAVWESDVLPLRV
ncbi:MAG: DEAD/DEAH box helicase, partial [SAR202 cluster bacterium]|nr:DEAD/DEAH box helicase [SAR202 cluster bacterium]